MKPRLRVAAKESSILKKFVGLFKSISTALKRVLLSVALAICIVACNTGMREMDKPDCSKMVYIPNPFNCETNQNFARCSQLQGDYKMALFAFRQCLSHCDTDFNILNNIGDCLFKLDSTEEAIPYFNLALKLNQENPTTNYNLAVAYWEKEDYAAAKSYIEDALKYSKEEDNECYSLYGEILFQLHEFEEAEKMMRKAIELNDSNLFYKRRLGAILGSRGKYKEALEITNDVLKNEKLDTIDLVNFLDLKSLLLVELGDSANACETVQKIYNLKSDFQLTGDFRFCDD